MASQFKTFVAGDVLTASEVNSYLMKQTVIVCDSSSDYPGSPVEGMVVYDKALDRGLLYTGSAWVPAFGKTPSVRCRKSANQNNTFNTVEAVQFDGTDDWDTDSFHDPSTNNTRVTIPTGLGGRYRFVGSIGWVTWTGIRAAALRKNGSTTMAQVSAEAVSESNPTQIQVSAEMDLSAGDYIELTAWWTVTAGSGSLAIEGSTPGYSTWLEARWLHA